MGSRKQAIEVGAEGLRDRKGNYGFQRDDALIVLDAAHKAGAILYRDELEQVGWLNEREWEDTDRHDSWDMRECIEALREDEPSEQPEIYLAQPRPLADVRLTFSPLYRLKEQK